MALPAPTSTVVWSADTGEITMESGEKRDAAIAAILASVEDSPAPKEIIAERQRARLSWLQK